MTSAYRHEVFSGRIHTESGTSQSRRSSTRQKQARRDPMAPLRRSYLTNGPRSPAVGHQAETLDTSVTPARVARWTKALSKETNAAPAGRLFRCRASANSTPFFISDRAGTQRPCPPTARSEVRTASSGIHSPDPLRIQTLRRTHAVSSSTVFAIQIDSEANSLRAAAACRASSPVSKPNQNVSIDRDHGVWSLRGEFLHPFRRWS